MEVNPPKIVAHLILTHTHAAVRALTHKLSPSYAHTEIRILIVSYIFVVVLFVFFSFSLSFALKLSFAYFAFIRHT